MSFSLQVARSGALQGKLPICSTPAPQEADPVEVSAVRRARATSGRLFNIDRCFLLGDCASAVGVERIGGCACGLHDGLPRRPHTRDSAGKSISRLFDRLISMGGEKPHGASLGSLRHTCATVMDLAHDQPMIDLVMGHVSGSVEGSRKKSLQKRIYSQLNLGELDRLAAVAEVVRSWLFYGKISGLPSGRPSYDGPATVPGPSARPSRWSI